MVATFRRYGPSSVHLQPIAAPDLGRGAEQTWAALNQGFASVNRFLYPAVEREQTVRGQKEAMAAVEKDGPKFDIKRTTPTSTSEVALGTANAGAEKKPVLIGGPTRENAAIVEAAKANGVDPVTLMTIAQLESGGNPNAQNPSSSAGGLFQFTDATAGQYGLINKYDPIQSADAGARLARDNQKSLQNALGRQPTTGEIYLAHQQGAGGAAALLSHPNENVVDVLARVYGGDRDKAAQVVQQNGGSVDMTAGQFAGKWTGKADRVAGRASSVTLERDAGLADYEIEVLNKSSFEPRMPFTIRNAAFNAAADRVIETRAMSALEQGISIAQAKADGNIEVLRKELEKVHAKVIGSLPKELPGLAISLEQSFERSKGVAERQAIQLAQSRVIAGQKAAADTAVAAISSEAERLALTGASSGELAAHLTQSQDALAAFGPRGEFTVNGKTYPADPSRAGLMTPADIAANVMAVEGDARRLMIEAEFEKSQAKGAFVDELRRQVFAGNGPLSGGENLKLLRELEARARSAESERRSSAEAERRRLEKETDDRINSYVSMTEAGVPVAIPQSERTAILSALAPYPDLQRKAEQEFAVADAAVDTFNMTGPELLDYVDRVREDMTEAAKRGDIDLDGAAVVASLQDRVKKAQDAVSADAIGLPLVEQLAVDGARSSDIDWDALRTRAAGKKDLLASINEIEAFYRDVESMEGLSAWERDQVLADARASLSALAAQGDQYGEAALTTSHVLDRLQEWSSKRADLAKNDAVKYAASIGVALPSLAEATSMAEAGAIIAQRVDAIAPKTSAEGVDYPVPLTQQEVDAISETFRNSNRSDQMAFLGALSDMGEEQAGAILARIGRSEPVLYAAGSVYAGGNKTAASTILRGSVDTKLGGGAPDDIAAARSAVLGDLIGADILAPEGLADLDTAALAYARGAAMADGGREIKASDIEDGYRFAMGEQEDGTGGVTDTAYGTTILPAGWDARRVNAFVSGLTPEQIGGTAEDRMGRAVTMKDLKDEIEGLRPSPDDQHVFIPVDRNGDVFIVRGEGGLSMLTLDLRDATRKQVGPPVPEISYRQWRTMTRKEREDAGLPTSEIGGQVYFRRFQAGF